MNLRVTLKIFALCVLLIAAMPASRLSAQHLTLEGQTGGFLTPTAYVVYAEKGSSSRIRPWASISSMLRR